MNSRSGKLLITIQIVALIVLQVAATIFLWTLNAVTTTSTQLFALFLSADLMSFAIISFVYREYKQNNKLRLGWVIAGYAALAVLLLSSVIFA